MEIAQIIAKPEHHAYLIFGYTPQELCAVDRCEGLHIIQTDTALGVDAVRELHGYAFQKTDGTERKIVLSTPHISFQAQNALLKVMEEAGQGTYFFLCLPQGAEILSTLRSRCYLVDKDSTHMAEPSEHFKKFVAAPAKKRLKMIEEIWDQGESTRHIAILQLLQDFEMYLHQSIVTDTAIKNTALPWCIRAVQNLRNAIYTGALHKGTLQTLAFV